MLYEGMTAQQAAEFSFAAALVVVMGMRLLLLVDLPTLWEVGEVVAAWATLCLGG